MPKPARGRKRITAGDGLAVTARSMTHRSPLRQLLRVGGGMSTPRCNGTNKPDIAWQLCRPTTASPLPRRFLMNIDIDRRSVVAVLAGLAGAVPALAPTSAAAADAVPGARDFDFFFGRWQVRHRRLKERLAGSREWIEFDGTSVAQPLLGGFG